MAIYSLGYATKSGMKVVVQTDDGKQKTIMVKSKPVGNMFAPNPDDFVEKIMSQLRADDIVLTPSGPNHSYVAGCARVTRNVFWANPGTLVEHGAKTPKQLLALYYSNPEV